MRIGCSRCGKSVSNEVPEGTIVAAWIECVDCLKKDIAETTGDCPECGAVVSVKRGVIQKHFREDGCSENYCSFSDALSTQDVDEAEAKSRQTLLNATVQIGWKSIKAKRRFHACLDEDELCADETFQALGLAQGLRDAFYFLKGAYRGGR